MGSIARLVSIVLLMAGIGIAVILLLVVKASPKVRTRAYRQGVRRMGDLQAGVVSRLSEMAFFFGHQSVGSNLVSGMQDLMDGSNTCELSIEETVDANRIGSGVFSHASVGCNWKPETKVAEFREVLEAGVGDAVDVAFLKFCFVDVRSDSDPQALLDTYCSTIEALKVRFPNVVFLHVTVPLCAAPQTLKSNLKLSVKRIVGASTVFDDNRVRARYNDLLRERFSGKEPLFDLAGCESVSCEGMQWFVSWKGREIPVLGPPYTDDGGHLNAVGRRHAAEQLLIELSTILEVSE